MPINEEPYNVFLLCSNAYLRNAEGKPIDIDISALSSAILALKYSETTLISVASLMRYLLQRDN